MLSQINMQDLLTAIILVGSAVGVVYKWIIPAFKVTSRVRYVEEKINSLEAWQRQLLDTNTLLCRGVFSIQEYLIHDGEKNKMEESKDELLKFITKNPMTNKTK